MAHQSPLQLNLATNVPASRQRRGYKLPLLHKTHCQCSLSDINKYRCGEEPYSSRKHLDRFPPAAKTPEVFPGCRVLQRDRISKEIDEELQFEQNDVCNLLHAVLPSHLRLHDLFDRTNRPKTYTTKQPWLVQHNWVQCVLAHDL